MDNVMRTMVETAAQLLLQEYRKEHPEWQDDRTPIDEIAGWLGLDVATFHSADYAEGTYGFIDPDEDENLIWLCRDLQENFRRFTLSHEIGHAVLHCHGGRRLTTLSAQFLTLAEAQNTQQALPVLSRTDPCNTDDVQEDLAGYLEQEQMLETLGLGHAYNPRSERELAANLFAAELLIPHQRLRELYLDTNLQPSTLAALFGVSQSALLNRLIGLLNEPAADTLPPLSLEEPGATPVKSEKKRYDDYQQAAIEAETPALIVAGPGSGKTSTLIGRAEYLINTLHIPAQNILALTFSRKATEEMEERLQKLLPGEDQALPKVSTFHAFCADLLRQYGELVGLREDFILIDEAEGYFILQQQANHLYLRHLQKLHAPTFYFQDILSTISRAKDELIAPEDYARLAQTMKEHATLDEEALEDAEKALETALVYERYQQELQRRGDTDFGGLLMLAVQLLRQHPEIQQELQQKYQHILVDEFQDVNRASSILLRELAGNGRRVWVVGDANQAIYGFRGASAANISQFEQDFPGAVILPLSRNYRSRPDLVAIAESFRCHQLELGEEPGKNQPVRLTHDETYVTLAQTPDEASELAGIIQDIRQKHSQGYAYKDMVVLCRKRAQVRKISRVLAAAGLPVHEQGGLLDQEYIKDVLALPLLMTNASGMGLLRAARQPEHPLTQSDIEALLLAAREPQSNPRLLIMMGEAPLTMSTEGRYSLDRLSQIIHSLQHARNTWSLLAQYLLIETELIRSQLRLAKDQRDNARLADYLKLLQLARHFDQQQTLRPPAIEQDQEEPGEPGIIQQVEGFLEYLSLLVLLRQDSTSRQQGDENAEEPTDIIRVMTVHASKGLEFPIVYMPYLSQQRFPGRYQPKQIPLPHGLLTNETDEKTRHANEESCLFYVGVTRARDHVILSYSQRYGKRAEKRSTYLDALEAGLPEGRIIRLYWDEKNTGPLPIIQNEVQLPSSQPGTEFIDAMRTPTLSSRTIEAYQRCPRQYAYSNIYHFTGDESAYQLFWQATHEAVEEMRKKIEGQEAVTPQEIQELYNQKWQAMGGHTAPFPAMYEEHGHEVIETMHSKLHTQTFQNWELRAKHNIEVEGKTVHVTIDRVEVSTEKQTPTRFVRTRFGNRKGKPEAETRDMFYALVYRQLHPGQKAELHSHNMSTGEIMPITMTPRKEQTLYEGITQAIRGLEKNDYPAQPTQPMDCPRCPFFFICPA